MSVDKDNRSPIQSYIWQSEIGNLDLSSFQNTFTTHKGQSTMIRRTQKLLSPLIAILFLAYPLLSQTLPNETPAKFTPTNDGFDYTA